MSCPLRSRVKVGLVTIIMKSIFSLVPLALLVLAGARAEIDESKPDLSRFKLRRVGTATQARDRATEEVRSTSLGAKFMHESLFTDALYVVCPAYEHLFRLIENQNRIADTNGTPSPIRQDVIEMLAVVVTSDRILYHRLLRKNIVSGEAGRHFIEAAKSLEGSLSDRDTWLELVHCMQAYMGEQEPIVEYLNQPERAKLLTTLATFKALPTDIDLAVANEKPPHDLVNRLAKRFDGGRPRLALEASQLEASLLRQASEVIERLDDEETAEERKKQLTTETSIEAENDLVVEQESGVPELPERVEANVVDVKAPEVSNSPAVEVELVLPEKNQVIDKKEPARKSCDIAVLTVMKFIKLRLLKGAGPGKPPLTMQNAYDFYVHWHDLQDVEIDTSTPTGRDCEDFRDAPSSQMIAERVGKVILTYIEMGDLFASIKDKQARSKLARRNKTPPKGLGEGWTSMDEFRKFFARLTGLLVQLDPGFDMDDMRRYYTSWKKVYVEYDTLDKFINNEFW